VLGKEDFRAIQSPYAENRTYGGVGGCRGAIPGTRPDRSTLTRMRGARTIRADLNHAIPIDLRDGSKLHFLPAHDC
jgi:hypothetical protein